MKLLKKAMALFLTLALAASCASVFALELERGEMDPEGWTFDVNSINANDGVPAEVPENVIDGDPQTHWHSMINPKDNPPFRFTVILPKAAEVSGLRYIPRADGGAGIFENVNIYGSLDGTNFYRIASDQWAINTDTKEILFGKNIKVTHLMLEAVSAFQGYGSMGELRLLSAKTNQDSADITSYEKASVALSGKTSGGNTQQEENEPAGSMVYETYTDELPTDGWTFEASSTNANGGVPAEVPEKVIDGDPQSHWHTMINPKANPPFDFVVILPEETAVAGLRYTPRADGGAGIVTEYKIYVSSDGGKTYSLAASGNWAKDTAVKTAKFPAAVKADRVKLEILSADQGYGSCGELRLIDGGDVAKAKEPAQIQKMVEENMLYVLDYANITAVDTCHQDGMTAQALFDGDRNTIWHTTFAGPMLPATLDINLGAIYQIKGFNFVPRQDDTVGHWNAFNVSVSSDGVSYQRILENQTFGTVSYAVKEVLFPQEVRAKHVRIEVISGEGNHGSAGEIQLLQLKSAYEQGFLQSQEKYELIIDDPKITVTKNGKAPFDIALDAAPFIYRDTTMIPLRGLFEEMGATVTWIEETQNIEVTRADQTIIFQLEDDRVYIDGIRYNLTVKPMLRNDRTFIPLRFVSEQMGYLVSWDGDARKVTIENQ